MTGRKTMSLEAAMDEERLAILEILERQAASKAAPATSRRSDSPATNLRSLHQTKLGVGSPDSSLSPGPVPHRYRSMLDVDDAPSRNQATGSRSRTDSGADISTNSSPGPARSARSSISEAPSAVSQTGSRPTAEVPHEGGAARQMSPNRERDPLSKYQFSDIITSQIGQTLPMPKRNQQLKRSSLSGTRPQSHAPPVSPTGPGTAGAKPGMRRGPQQGQSTSPHGRRSLRGLSPPPGAKAAPEKPAARVTTLDSGYSLDLDKAYKNLSYANMMASEGPLAALARQKVQEQEAGEGRLDKSYVGPDGESLHSSSDDEGEKDSDDLENGRGRDTAPRIIYSSASDADGEEPGSLLAAVEDERKFRCAPRSQCQVSQDQHRYCS
jgi:hypothetical protein